MKFLAVFALIAVASAGYIKPTAMSGELAEIAQIVSAIQSPNTDPATAVALQAMLVDLLGENAVSAPLNPGVPHKPSIVSGQDTSSVVASPAIVNFPSVAEAPIAVGPAIVNPQVTSPVVAHPEVAESVIAVGPAIVSPQVVSEAVGVVASPAIMVPQVVGDASQVVEFAPAGSSPSGSAALIQIILNINANTPVEGVAASAVAAIPEAVSVAHAPVQGVAVADFAPEAVSVVNAPVQGVAIADFAPETVSVINAPVQGVSVAEIAPEAVGVVAAAPETVSVVASAPEAVAVATPIIAAPAVNLPDILN